MFSCVVLCLVVFVVLSCVCCVELCLVVFVVLSCVVLC